MKKKWLAIVGLLMLGTGIAVGRFWSSYNAKVEYGELKERLAKFEDYFAITNKWLKNRNQNVSVADYFKRMHYERVAIYGMGELGKRLYEELCEKGIQVPAVFDRSAQRLDPALNVCSLEGPVPEVDVVVITPTFDYKNIEKQLKNITSCDIVSIADVVMK